MEDALSLIYAVAVALIPGVLNALLGHRLLAVDDEATLQERLARLRRILTLPAFLGLLGCVVLGRHHVLWLALLLAIGILLGGFRTRKRVLEETWGLWAYLGFTFRLWLGFSGFWMLMAFTPLLIRGFGRFQLLGVAVLGVTLFLGSYFYGRILLKLLGARPMDGQIRAPYADVFQRIEERIEIPAPELWWIDMAGGRWVNALALPGFETSRVAFSGPLLHDLEPDEVGAIYAHELGHLEYLGPARLRSLRIMESTLIVLTLGVAWVPFLPWAWPLIVLLALGQIAKRRRAWETDADSRALELCGDAEVLITALVKVHRTLAPRRLPVQVERNLTHPSLARRIQALRRAASEAGSGASVTDLGSLPSVVPGSKRGTAVLFDRDRVHWLKGVDGSPDPHALVQASSDSMPYGDLVELRLDRGLWRGPVLWSTTVEGKRRRFALPAESTTEIQRVLDLVDDQLATEMKGPKAKTSQFREILKATLLWIFIFAAVIFLWKIGGF